MASLAESIEVIQSGMVYQVSGVKEEQETAGKEGLDKWKTLSYSLAKTASQIAPVLTPEMMAKPTLSLAMMSLMQQLAKDSRVDMADPG